jgi:hypothetical protein
VATEDEKRRALLILMTVGPEATAALIRECETDEQVAAWVVREKRRFDSTQAAQIAPALRQALQDMTPAGAARNAARSRRATPTAP